MTLRNTIISLMLTLGFVGGAFAGSKKIPQSEHVKYLFSAGDRRDYSEAIQRNQQEYATHRGVEYRFFNLGEKDSSVIKALNGKQKYWAKIVILQQAMDDPKVPEASWVAWTDDDIVFNDINHNRAMMDRVIEKYGEGKSVLVAKEESDWAYLNTGIILAKKGKSARAVLARLMEKSERKDLGYKTQAEHSFHEQGALKELYLGKKGAFDTTTFGKPLKEYVGLIPQRDGELNFNNFRRYTHTDEARNMKLVYNDREIARAKDTDAFIHHTGMAMNKRGELIRETLAKVTLENNEVLYGHGYSPAMSFYEQFVAPSCPRTKAGEQPGQKPYDFVLLSSEQSDAQLKQEQKEHRDQRKKLAKARVQKQQDERRQTREDAEKAKRQTKAAAEQQHLYKTLLTAQLKDDAETSLQGLQSLGSATSMMMLTTLTGLSSVMSSYRSGGAFSFGMASIDDIPTSEMLARTAPTARSPVISRESGSWHNFVHLHMMRGNRKDVNSLPGGSINGQGLSAGVFYQLNPEMIAGMMLSVNKNTMSFNQGGSGKVSSISVGPFMSYSLDDWHIDAALSISRDSYELRRKGITGSELKSEFAGTSLTAYLGTGYDIHLDHWTQGLTLTPMAELMFIHSRHGDYHEKGSAREALQVKSASNRQFISRLGFETAYLFPNLKKPTEIKTRFGIQHQNMSAQNTSYQLPAGTAGQVSVPAMSERSFFTGLGIQRQMGEHSKVALNYNGTHSANGNSHGFQIEFEKKF